MSKPHPLFPCVTQEGYLEWAKFARMCHADHGRTAHFCADCLDNFQQAASRNGACPFENLKQANSQSVASELRRRLLKNAPVTGRFKGWTAVEDRRLMNFWAQHPTSPTTAARAFLRSTESTRTLGAAKERLRILIGKRRG